jgi:hypothetical protein
MAWPSATTISRVVKQNEALAAVFEGRRELFEAFTTDDGIEQPPLFISTTKWK